MATPKKPKKIADPAFPHLVLSHAEPGTMRHRIETMLVYLYKRTEAAGFVGVIQLEDVARDTILPMPLVVKISRHLEQRGMLEYDHGAIDLTVSGMIEAESMQQARPSPAVTLAPPNRRPKA